MSSPNVWRTTKTKRPRGGLREPSALGGCRNTNNRQRGVLATRPLKNKGSHRSIFLSLSLISGQFVTWLYKRIGKNHWLSSRISGLGPSVVHLQVLQCHHHHPRLFTQSLVECSRTRNAERAIGSLPPCRPLVLITLSRVLNLHSAGPSNPSSPYKKKKNRNSLIFRCRSLG